METPLPRLLNGDTPGMLPLVAISDLHLGVPYSLLDDEAGRLPLLDSLEAELGDRHIGTLVLLGDFCELTQLVDDEAFRICRDFMGSFLARFQVGNLVMVPGNHDHHLWTRAVRDAVPEENVWIGALNLKGRLFDSPLEPANYGGLIGRCISEEDADTIAKIALAYPDFLVEHSIGGRKAFCLFHHGHLVKRSFVSKEMTYRLQRQGMVQLAKAKSLPSCNVDEPWKAVDLLDLQARTQRFFETLFYPKNDEGAPPDDAIVHLVYLHQREKKAWGKNSLEFSQSYAQKKFMLLIKGYLACGGYLPLAHGGQLSYIFGDSHDGGLRHSLPVSTGDKDASIDLFNTGFWLATGPSVTPGSLYFLLRGNGNRTLARVAYTKDLIEKAREKGLSWRPLNLRNNTDI